MGHDVQWQGKEGGMRGWGEGEWRRGREKWQCVPVLQHEAHDGVKRPLRITLLSGPILERCFLLLTHQQADERVRVAGTVCVEERTGQMSVQLQAGRGQILLSHCSISFCCICRTGCTDKQPCQYHSLHSYTQIPAIISRRLRTF